MRAEEGRKALDAALKLIKFRGRSAKDLAEQLVKKRFTKAEAAATVARLIELKILDEEALARMWAGNARREGHGAVKIGHELRQRGIPADVIARVLTKTAEKTAPTEADRAREVMTRRIKLLVTAGLDPKALTRRLGGHLIRQGFSEKIVRETLDAYFKDTPPGGEAT